ncbi:unnamed protein product [Leuciscus chuanchicus]
MSREESEDTGYVRRDVKEAVWSYLPGLPDDLLTTMLDELGVESIEDLTLVEERDLVKYLKPIQSRKLTKGIKDGLVTLNMDLVSAPDPSAPSSPTPCSPNTTFQPPNQLLPSPPSTAPSTSSASQPGVPWHVDFRLNWDQVSSAIQLRVEKEVRPLPDERKAFVVVLVDQMMQQDRNPTRAMCHSVVRNIVSEANMSRASSPAVRREHLAKDASDLQHLSQTQLDTELNELITHDPTQSYNYKDGARIVSSVAHNVVAQARLSERSNIDLEQQAATLKLQAEEARRDQARTQSRLDQLLLETQYRREKEDATDPELQKEVERLRNALQDLRLDTDQREQLERETRKELNEKLQQSDALLRRAETELKETDAKARACEKHLQKARAKIGELTLQRDELQDELDTVHAELRHSYRLQSGWNGETHITEFLPASHPNPFSQEPRAEKGDVSPPLKTSPARFQEHLSAAKGGGPLQTTHATNHGTTPRELDKLARNIPMFDPDSAEGRDVHAYLKDIDFHLQTVANMTAWDNLYLLRITASSDVRSFLDRQPQTVKTDVQQLRQALIREFSDPDSDQGFFAAVDLKQGRREHPQTYYNRLRQVFFGARNEPGMEQDINFKTLFLRNLHPTLSYHLGVAACPRSMSTQQLRELAHKAYNKQKTISEKAVKNPTSYSVSEHCPELTLEGAPQHHSHRLFDGQSKPFHASRGQHNRGGARPKHQSNRSKRFWDQHHPPARTPSPDRDWNHSRHDTGKLNPEPTSEKHSAATSETAEILRVLKELLYRKTHKQDKKDPDILCLSIRTEINTLSDRHLTEPSTPNTARQTQTTELTVTLQGDSITKAPQLTAAHPERDGTLPHTRYQNTKVPGNAVLSNFLRSELHKTGPNHQSTVTPAMPTFLGNLIKKGVAQKLYLVITLEKEVSMEALIDTGSDITVISNELFKRLQFGAKRQDQTLTPQTCELNVQSYSQHDIRLEQVAHIHLTIGPLSLVHPVFISKMDTFPFLIGRDLLDRFEPLLDLKQLKVWAQVREHCPLQSQPDGQVTRVTEFMGTPTASQEDTDSAPTEGLNPLPCTLQPTKDFDTCCLNVMTDLQRHNLIQAIAKPGALNNKLWSLSTHPPTLKREVITHSIRTLQATLPTSEPLTLAPLFAKTTTTDMRASDIYIKTSNAHLSNPSNHPCMPSDLTDNQCLRPLHDTTHMLREQKTF